MNNDIASDRIELFRYYVEQARHTEVLWIQISKYFTTIITGLVAATAFLVKTAAASDAVIAFVVVLFSLGAIISFFAFGVVLSYQILIQEWVKKKQVMEEAILNGGDEELGKLGVEKILPIRKPKTHIMPLSAGIFLIFGLLFIVAISISLSQPEWVYSLTGQ